MSRGFEELDHCVTALGELSLRRRIAPSLGAAVFEVKLGDEFLMSSLFTVGEIALAERGLQAANADELDVVVGGLGLGCTARAALDHARLRSLLVIEAIPAVIDWHRRGLVPLGAELAADPRCRLVHGDFFALCASARGFDPEVPGCKFHAVLLDIDHSPRQVLDSRHGSFYKPEGLRGLAEHLHPGGVFALWSNDRPDKDFASNLDSVFERADAHVVEFDNPIQNRTSANTIYVARAKSAIAI